MFFLNLEVETIGIGGLAKKKKKNPIGIGRMVYAKTVIYSHFNKILIKYVFFTLMHFMLCYYKTMAIDTAKRAKSK